MMRINSLNSGINFTRKLHPNEEADFSDVLKQGKQKLGNTGHSILIVPSASLPQEINTGVGNLLDREGQNFIDFAKLYWGINYVQLLPEGEYKIFAGNRYLPYSGSSLSLGTHLINPNLLTTEEYGKILNQNDIKQIVDMNRESFVNFENVIAKDSITERMLRKAYDELLKADNEPKKRLLTQLKSYIQANNDWLEPKAIFAALSSKYESQDVQKWSDFDRNMYNEEIVPLNERLSAIKGIRGSELGKEANFYEFKQFLSENHLEKARQNLHQKGIKLSGDVLIGFSNDEIWANPKAFIKDCEVGWGIKALNLDTLESEKLLRKKFNLFARRYDALRIDASWIYAAEPLANKITGQKSKKEYGSRLLDIIDDEIKKVKGKDYNYEDIMHEFVAKREDFDIYEEGKIKPFIDKRTKIYCSNSMNAAWGTVDNFKKRGWKEGSYVLGTTNHDCIPMKKQYADSIARKEQAKILSEILKIPQDKINSLNEFIKAKFAEPMRAKHNMVFFSDALNLDALYKDNITKSLDYRLKIPESYSKNYFESLQRGEGFNVMDALEKAFISNGLDKTESKLYKKIVKYHKILEQPESAGVFNSKIYIALGVGIGVISGLTVLLFKNRNKINEK